MKEGAHTKHLLTSRTPAISQHLPYLQQKSSICNATTKIDQKSISMAQNIINLEYTHVPNAGNAIVPAGHVNQLPPNSLGGNVDVKRPDHRKLSEHKVSMGFTLTVQGKDLYRQLRKAVKNQLLARNFTTLGTLPDHDFQQIKEGMRRLYPVCDSLVNA